MLINYTPFQATSVCLGINSARVPEMQLFSYEYVFMASEPGLVWWTLTDPYSGEKIA